MIGALIEVHLIGILVVLGFCLDVVVLATPMVEFEDDGDDTDPDIVALLLLILLLLLEVVVVVLLYKALLDGAGKSSGWELLDRESSAVSYTHLTLPTKA